MTQPLPSLAAFERLVAARQHKEAATEALRVLRSIDERMGGLTGMDFGVPTQSLTDLDLHTRFSTRFAAAFGDFLTQPDVVVADHAVELFFIYHRWSDLMFQLSGFQTSSHLLARLGPSDGGRWQLRGSNLIQFLLVLSPSEGLGIDLDEAFAANPGATVVAALGYLSARSCVKPNAGAFRERLLEWLPGKMDGMTLGRFRLACIAEIYMHCSYAFTPNKHKIKADLIAQMRKVLLGAGAKEMVAPPPRRKKPRIVVVAEHFRAGHSVFRTHSRAVKSLRERFEVIGVAYGQRIDDAARACFDDLITYPDGELIESARATADLILERQPDIVFHLGVGMANHVIALASLRLAPIQCCSYGHTATTMSPVIDYQLLPDDFVASEERFSETVIRLPAEAIPYAAPAPEEPPLPARGPLALPEGPLRVAIPASLMKINAPFLDALVQISARTSRPVEFVFYPLAAVGLAYYQLRDEIKRVLPSAVVNTESSRSIYLERLGACAFFLCPFPYGNMNSIIDAVIMGVPGVCLDGEEAHSHADVAIFRRLGLPDELATDTVEAYIAAAVRLIDDPDWLDQCRRTAREIDLNTRFYGGDERLFCEAVYGLLAKTAEPVS